MHYVFQKEKRKVMVTDFIDSVLIIDDKEDEIKDLQQVLEEEDIFVQFLNPTDKKLSDLPVLKKHKQVVFIDLSLDDSINILNNVSTKIRPLLSKILPKTKGCYGLVVWSKHTEDVNILKEKLQEDKGKYTLPIFIVPFDKNEYLQKGYDEILNDLNNTLKSDKAAYFFVSWMSTVKSAANNAMSDIYSLVPEYDKQKTELMYLMYKMALNHTGIPEKQIEGYDLTTDAYKAFDELLYSDLINQQNKNSINIFDSISKTFNENNLQDEVIKYAKLNAKLFIDTINIDPKIIVPGNVYEIIDGDRLQRVENQPKKSMSIVIELTPPCDFSHKKINSKLIRGFIYPPSIDNDNLWNKINKTFKGDNKYLLWPIEINGELCMICFDFRYTIIVSDEEIKRESSKYKVLFRVKPKLFADILQKYASYSARLGISIITPELKQPASK